MVRLLAGNPLRGRVTSVSTDSGRGEFIDRTVKIKRCAAVVKGGRRFSFAALVVVGDGRGRFFLVGSPAVCVLAFFG